jgi:hypothetical protein
VTYQAARYFSIRLQLDVAAAEDGRTPNEKNNSGTIRAPSDVEVAARLHDKMVASLDLGVNAPFRSRECLTIS